MRVRDQLISEGLDGAYVNGVPIHAATADWEYDR